MLSDSNCFVHTCVLAYDVIQPVLPCVEPSVFLVLDVFIAFRTYFFLPPRLLQCCNFPLGINKVPVTTTANIQAMNKTSRLVRWEANYDC